MYPSKYTARWVEAAAVVDGSREYGKGTLCLSGQNPPMPVDPGLDPRLDSMAAIIEAITGQPYGSGGGPRPEEEIRVVLPMDAWDELEYLAADDTDEPTDLATLLSLARDGADVMCEGEQEGDEWAFYVAGFTLEELLPLAQEAVPLRWKVDRVPVHPDAIAVTQIAITRRRC